MKSQSVADIVGPWVDPNFESGLIERIRKSWNVPIDKLSNEMLATFLRQQIATDFIVQETRKRLELGFDDDSEIYEGELALALREAEARPKRDT